MSLCENSVQIDDFDERIVYSGPWQTVTDQADVSYNGTRHVAPAPGLSAIFKFNGSCLIVNGLVGANGSRPMPPTTFVLDGHFRQMNTSDVFPGEWGSAGAGAAGLVPAMLYAAVTISNGPHELIVTSLGGNASAPLVLDGFIVTPTEDDPGSAPSSPSASSAAGAGSGPSSHSHTGTIIGAVVGGLGGLLLLALLAFLARHWRRRRHAAASEIRPFAAWRGDGGGSGGGGGQPVLRVSVGPEAGLYAEKMRLPMCAVTQTSASSVPTGSSTPSEPSTGTIAPPAPAPVVLRPQRWSPRDAKVQPPEYTP